MLHGAGRRSPCQGVQGTHRFAGDAAATGDAGDVAEAVVAQAGDCSFRVGDAGQVLGGVVAPPFAKGGTGGFTPVAEATTTSSGQPGKHRISTHYLFFNHQMSP